MAMTYIMLYNDLSRTVDKFSDDEAGRLLKAILHYNAGDYEGILKEGQREEAVFSMLQGQFDRDRDNYEKKVVQNRTNGAKGGRPPKENPNNPPVFEKTEKNQEEEKEKENKNENEKYVYEGKKKEDCKGERKEEDSAKNVLTDVYNQALKYGFNPSNETYSSIKCMISHYGAEKVMEGIKTCAVHHNTTPVYLATVLKQ